MEDIENLEAGIYSLIVTDANDCMTLKDSIVVSNTVNIENLITENHVDIYPNPTSDLSLIHI